MKCRLLTKMRLDQDQYSLPHLPNATAHLSTDTGADKPQDQPHCKSRFLASQLGVMQRQDLFYKSITFERLG